MIAVLTALAGGLGAVLRFVLDSAVAERNRSSVPLGTMLVNVTGSFLLGLLTGWFMFHTGPGEVQMIVGTGVLGGYTTFSTASVEAVRFARSDRRWAALGHAAVMLLVSLATAFLGVWLMA